MYCKFLVHFRSFYLFILLNIVITLKSQNLESNKVITIIIIIIIIIIISGFSSFHAIIRSTTENIF